MARERPLVPRLAIWAIPALPSLFWAGNIVIGRAASHDVPPVMLAFARHFIGLLTLLPFGLATMKRDRHRYWKLRWQVVRAALAGMVTFNLLVYVGLHSTTASNAQLLNSAIPVLTILFGTMIAKHRLQLAQIAGLVLSCAGVLVVILHGQLSWLVAMQFTSGDLIVFAAMVSFSLFTLWLQDFPPDLDRLGLLGAQFLIAVVVLFPLLVWEFVSGARPNWSPIGIAAMLYVGVAAAFLANLLYMISIKRVGAARAGMFIHLVPLYGAIMSVGFLGEKLHVYHVVGMAAIIGGLAFSQRNAPVARRSHIDGRRWRPSASD